MVIRLTPLALLGILGVAAAASMRGLVRDQSDGTSLQPTAMGQGSGEVSDVVRALVDVDRVVDEELRVLDDAVKSSSSAKVRQEAGRLEEMLNERQGAQSAAQAGGQAQLTPAQAQAAQAQFQAPTQFQTQAQAQGSGEIGPDGEPVEGVEAPEGSDSVLVGD